MPKITKADSSAWAEVDESGRLIFPPELTRWYGLLPGSQVRIDEETNGLHLHRPPNSLARVYIEPTAACNLACRTCIRNVWEEPLGAMSQEIFTRIVEGLQALDAPATVFFGGFGEPLHHPGIVEMVAQAKAAGCRAELITNGTLLSQQCSRGLIRAGLDVLWVSLDGATPESYADVRLGAALPEVLSNIDGFRKSRRPSHRPTPEIGIAFVAMKRNIADMQAMLRLSKRIGASRYFVSNVLPYTQEMCAEVLYTRVLSEITYIPSRWVPHLDMPRMDAIPTTQEALFAILRGGYNLSYSGDNMGRANDRCPFIERGSTSITWDGNLCPCLPLTHDYDSFLFQRQRRSRRYVVGNLSERSLTELWNDPEYVSFRRKVQEFDFAPCTVCGGCDLAEANEEDCYGNTFPTCGGCLWAQGVVQCP